MPGSVRVNDGVIAVSCSGTSRVRRGQVVALDGALPAEQVAEDVADPVVTVGGRAFLPLAVFLAEAVPVLDVQRLQVGPFGGEHGDGQERAADLDQLEPVDVRLLGGPGR